MGHPLTRRRLLMASAGTLVSSATLAVPSVAAVKQLSAQERFDQHFAGLVDAMNDLTAGTDGWRCYLGMDDGKTYCKRMSVTLEREPVNFGAGKPVRYAWVEHQVDLDHEV